MPDSNPQLNNPVNTAPGVAVVIPFYNGSAFIERALRSIAAQSVPAAEVVVVNDGSTDEERAFLERLQPQHGFKLINQANGGQGAARNAGVAAASAPYICFLDQDDFYLENHNRILIESIPLDEPRWGYVFADLWEADGAGQIFQHTQYNGPERRPKHDLLAMLRDDLFVLPSAALIRRAAFAAVGGFDTQFMGYEDDDLFLRLFRAGYTSHYVDKAVTVWCKHVGSTSFSMRMNRSRFRYFKKLAAAFPDEPDFKRFYLRDCLMPRFGRYFVGAAIQAIELGDDNLPELRDILDEYVAIVQASPVVRDRAKLKLRVAQALVHRAPRGLVHAVNVVTKLPVIRRLRPS